MQKNFYRTLGLVALSAILATGSAAVKEQREIKRDLSTSSGFELMGHKYDDVTKGRKAPDQIYLKKGEKKSVSSSSQKENSLLTDIIVKEDFSKWYEGSEEDPVYAASIPDFWVDPDVMWDISAERTQQPGWAGFAIYCAGGVAGLCYPNYGGYVQTPQGEYAGKLNVSFKAKVSSKETKQNPTILVIMARGNWSLGSIMDYSTFTVPNDGEWHEFIYEYENTYGGDDCFVQFNTYDLLFLDDVEITAEASTLPHPVMKPATDFTLNGFTANWGSVSKATDYLLSCYREVPLDDQNVILKEGFEAVKSEDGKIDWENPAIPEGWEINMNTVVTGDEAIDGNISLCFDENGQSIATPYTGSLIMHAEATFKVISGAEIYYDPETGEIISSSVPGYLQIEGWNGYKWVYWGISYQLGASSAERPRTLVFDDEVSGKFYQIRLVARSFPDNPSNPVIIALDNFVVETLPYSEREFAVKDLPVEGTSYVFDNLDPVSDYYYYVIARNTDLDLTSGEPDAGTFAFGICAPTPLNATDVSESGFTANWEPLEKAQGYEVECLEVTTIKEDENEYPVIIETFAPTAYLDYTVYDPFAFDNLYFMSLDEFCENPGWVGFLCGVARNSIGGIGFEMAGLGGEIQTPYLSLNHNDGKYNVVVSAWGTPGDYLYIVNTKGYGAAVPLSDEFEIFSLEMEGGCEFDYIGLFTSYNTPFFIDYFHITQDVKKGDQLLRIIDTVQTGNSTSQYLKVPETSDDSLSYAFDVSAKHTFLSNTTWSVRSKVQHVNMAPGSVKEINNMSAFAKGGKGTIEVIANGDVDIFSIDGKLIASFKDNNTINVPSGIYIVKTAGKTIKVLVK